MTRGAISGPSAHAGGDPTDIATRSELASALTRLRELSGLSVRDLAKNVDSPVATVGGYFSGRHLPTASQSAVFLRMLQACGVTDPNDQQRWWEAVARVRRTGRSNTPTEAPYLGLASFQVQDAALFFGRERLTAELIEVVRSAPGPAGRMVAVVGPSGSGKSSLVRAGLIPAIEHAGRSTPTVLTPGDRPLRRLAEALAASDDRPSEPTAIDASVPNPTVPNPTVPDPTVPDPVVDRIERAIRADPTQAAHVLAGRPGLLVVDQFEEVFTSCSDEAERRAFIAALCAVAGVGVGSPGSAESAAVVIALRADFYGQAIGEAALLPVLSTAQVVVGPMTPDEVRRAVGEPARIAGCEVDPDLVEVLIRDLTPHGAPSGDLEAGTLPLLSHALSVTWRQAARRRLTVAGYLATGGIAGAVAQSAEGVLAAMTTREQDVTTRLFLRMVNVDDDAVVTRRRMPLADLPGLENPEADDSTEAQDVVDRFVAARLLTIDAVSVQISHEALLDAWPRLQSWIDGSRVALAAHRRLGEALRVWRDNDRDPSALLGRIRLAAVQDSLAGGAVALTAAEAEFLQASEAAVADDRSVRRRRARRRRLIVAAMTALAVLASGLAVFAVVSNRAATTEQRAAADYRDLVVAGDLLGSANRVRPLDPNLADQLTVAAFRMSPTTEGRSALLDATAQPLVTRMLGPTGPTMQALSPDGRVLAVADASDGSIRLMSVTDPTRPTVLGTAASTAEGQEFTVSFGPDGRTLAAGSSKGVVQRWDVSDPTRPVALGEPLQRFPSGVFGVVFTPDGTTMLAGGEGGTIARWSLADPQHPVELPGLPTVGLVQTMAISADGSLLAVGGRAADLQLWSLTGPDGPTQVAAIPGAQSVVTASAFSPDGRTLAVGGRDGAVTVWSVTSPAAPVPIDAELTAFTNIANVVTFSADGSVLAAAGSDGTVRSWRTGDWTQIGQLGHPGPVTGLAVTADGARLFSSAADGTTRTWTIGGASIGPLPDSVFSLAWIADGRWLAAAPGPAANAMSIWDADDPEHAVELATAAPPDPDQRYGGGVAVSPDGRLMAVSLTDGRVQLWSVADPSQPEALGPPLSGPTDIVQQITFSADSRLLAGAANDASVWLWNVADPAAPRVEASMTDLGGPAYSVAFGAGDRLLAASTTAGQAKVWSLDDPAVPRLRSIIDAGRSYSFAVAISPDGRYLAVAGADRDIRRWDIGDPAAPAEVGIGLTGPANDVYWVDYSPDAHLLAAASTDGYVWLWDNADPAAPQPYATLGAATGPLFVAEFGRHGSMIAAGGSDRSVHRWVTDPAAAQAMICVAVGAPLTDQEWRTFLPGEPYDPPCT